MPYVPGRIGQLGLFREQGGQKYTNTQPSTLLGAEFRVARNRPYAGGHITARYGRPETGVHALQIELRRGLFMEEGTRQPRPAAAALERGLRELLADLATFVAEQMVPRPAAAD
jgi:N-formylglutamate amidohydrolase